MVGGVDTVRRAEGAEHFDRQFHVDHIDHLVAVLTEFAARDLHHERIPLAVVAVAENCCLEILVKWVVGGGVVFREAVFEEGLFCHGRTPYLIATVFCYHCTAFSERCQLLAVIDLPSFRLRRSRKKQIHMKLWGDGRKRESNRGLTGSKYHLKNP